MPTTREVRLKNIERRLLALERTLNEIKTMLGSDSPQELDSLMQKVLLSNKTQK
jgi:hypothetical protein